ncbi:MAG TPA: O-antigen ligase family protein [Patescibacteria group bacterium]|nr:O-antigen ligase family protein [Patescibacteria group bacterium]
MKHNAVVRVLFLLLIGVSVLGQLGRVQITNSIAFTLADFLILLFDVYFVLFKKLVIPPAALIVFLAWTVIMGHFSLAGAAYTMRFGIYVYFGWLLVESVKQKIILGDEIKKSIVFWIMGLAIIGILQYIFVPDVRLLKFLGWDDHYFRAISTIFDPNFFAALLVGGIIITKKNLKVPLALCIVALLLTYSRAGYVAFAVGMIGLFIIYRQKIYLGLLAAFMIGILLLPRPSSEGARLERTASINSRVESMSASVSNLNLSTVILGNGWYSLRDVKPVSSYQRIIVPNHASAPDNSLLFLFSSLGIIGMILWVGLLLVQLKTARWGKDAMLIGATFAVGSLFSNVLFYPAVLLFLSLTMGYSASLVSGRSPKSRR